MPLTLIPTTLDPVFTDTNFTDIIQVNDINSAPAQITSINISPALPLTVNLTTAIVMSNTAGPITLSGSFSPSVFPGVSITYITRGKSDKIETPTTVGSFDAIPSGKQVFAYKPPTQSTVTITITITGIDDPDAMTTDTQTITKVVEYDYQKGINSLRNYI